MIWKTFQIYWKITRPHRGLWFAAASLGLVFFTGMDIVLPWVITRFINDISNISGKTIAQLSTFLWLWAAIRLFVFGLGRVQIRFFYKAFTRTVRDIDLKSFEVTLSQSSAFFADNFAGSLVTKFNRFTRSFEIISGALLYDTGSLIVQFVFPFIILLYIAPIIGLILFVWTAFFVTILLLLHRKKIPLSREVAAYGSKATGFVADTITNALSIKMFAHFTQEYKSFESLEQKRTAARYKNLIFADHLRVYKTLSMILLELLVFYFSIKFAVQGSISVSEVLLIQFYIMQLTSSLWEFGKVVERLEEAVADATEMTEIYELEPSVKDPEHPEPFEEIKGQISLQNVRFTYEGEEEQPVFDHLSFSIPVGQKIGFVGPSGGGKTTLTKLLLRFMDVDSGRIMIDGHDISAITQDDLRRSIAYVPQEPLLFHKSIYANILYGNPQATREEVMKATKQAHADEFIDKLPQGYDTLVGERGVKLSGGQKQRVAIARAMLKKSPILILDEATSALDSKSEKLITNALDTLMKNRTTIVIAHRLSTIKKLDRIVVLTENGAEEDGTHDQLIKQKGLYNELWNHQHDDFLED